MKSVILSEFGLAIFICLGKKRNDKEFRLPVRIKYFYRGLLNKLMAMSLKMKYLSFSLLSQENRCPLLSRKTLGYVNRSIAR